MNLYSLSAVLLNKCPALNYLVHFYSHFFFFFFWWEHPGIQIKCLKLMLKSFFFVCKVVFL